MKIIKIFTVLIIYCFALNLLGCREAEVKISEDVLSPDLEEWLATEVSNRAPIESLDFAKVPLTKSNAMKVKNLLFADKQLRMLNNYGVQWDNRLLNFDDYDMPFYYNAFGEEPSDGRSLFISLHGGGGVAASQNDQQYNNQKRLYDDTMISLEGVYLAPRAPTNTWNLWHQGHIDNFLDLIIQMSVIKLNVNPNKVYLLGYSAGGDGVYQLAPRMADRFAAASMMAGHPNNASPLGLRNTPFAIHVGALDNAFDRNLVAQQWGEELDALQLNDPEGYIHEVQIYEGLGHWMNLKDAVALTWMKNYQRNPIPQKVVWKQNDRHHNNFYWLGIPENKTKNSDKVIASYDKTLNEINIIENSSEHLELLLNDEMIDLDEPVIIKFQGKEIGKKIFTRSILNIYQTMNLKGDANFSFSCKISILNNNVVTE